MVENKEQYGIPGLEIKGITIHNTGNENSAQKCYDLLEHSMRNNATHFFVDEKETLQFMPLDWCVFHTGRAYDWACKHTIAIEICRSLSDEKTYKQAEENAVQLIKELMNKYNLTTENIYFHKDFLSTTYCPHRILDTYGNKKEFIRRYF